MLKFFRQIRQRLLTENKFSKYLVYASGEILLVMIGILLALQVNNWNSNQIEKGLAKEYISRLSTELESEITHYKNIQHAFRTKEKRLKRIIKIWQSNPLIISDSLQYINDFTYAGDISLWYNEPVTWTQLVQSGEIRVIKDQAILDELHLYYNTVKKAADNYKMHPMSMTNKGREIFHHVFKYQDPDSYFDTFGGFFTELPSPYVFEQIEQNKEEYLQLYLTIAYVSKVQYLILTNIISKAEKNLNQLQSKLEA